MKASLASAILFVLIFASIASALPCSETAHPELCEEVMSSDASISEKDSLVTELIQDKRNSPNHDFVREWNSKIDPTRPPEGIAKKSKGFIKDAWLKLLTAMPSLLLNDNLYVNTTGELMSAYNHRIEIPPNYKSPGYPQTKNGDCETDYTVKQNTAKFTALLNTKQLGNTYKVNYTAQPTSTFKGEYDILLKTDIDHWKWKKYCCAKNKKGKCTKYCYKCEYRNTENQIDEIFLTDSFEAKRYDSKLNASFEIIDQYSNTTKGKFFASNFSTAKLSFIDSSFTEYNFIYTLNRSIPPDNVLTVKAEPLNRKESKNLNFRGNKTYSVIVKNIENCSILLQDHFNQKNISCNMTPAAEDPIISTDKTIYAQNETIIVTIEPSGEYNLSYAGQNYTTNGVMELKAEYAQNRINIFYKEKEISTIIHVKDNESTDLLLSISMFGGINYMLIVVLRKTWGAIL